MLDDRRQLGEQIAAARLERGMKLSDIARRTGRNIARVSEIERGKSNSTVDSIAEMGNAVGLKLIFVPADKLEEVRRLVEITEPRISSSFDAPNIWKDVFVDDRDEEEEAGLKNARR